MARDLFSERCAQILAVAPELTAYQDWLAAQRAKEKPRDYLFSDSQPRFEPRKDDVVVPMPGLSVQRNGGRAHLVCAQPPVDLPMPSLATRDVERVLDALDGERCLLEARWEAKVDALAFAKVLRVAFGLVLFAPEAVNALERRIPGVEITRFPGSPYGIDRPYWDNMADVRDYFEEHGGAIHGAEQLERCLREMHVLALMGRGLSSYYKPASPVSDRVVAPGALFLDAPRWKQTRRGTIFFDGPRVNVSLLGGAGYHRTVYASVGDEAALDSERVFESDGLCWGRVLTARSEQDEHFGPWFCPPRPIRQGHFERLACLLRDAVGGAGRRDESAALQALAGFHQGFVRLHPFHCANQSIAMNVVNATLSKLFGAGIPHLVLDHLALRLSEAAYTKVFERAVRAFAVAGQGPSERLMSLMDRKSRSFAMIERLGKSGDAAEADTIVRSDPDAARWALVID